MRVHTAIHRPSESQEGVTLAELLIVLVLMSIVMAIVVGPALRGYRDSQTARLAASELSLRLSFARSRAAEMNRTVRVDFGPGTLSPSNRFYTVYADLNQNGSLDAGEIDSVRPVNTQVLAGIKGWPLPPGISFSPPTGTSSGPLGTPVSPDGVAFTNEEIVFRPDGTALEAGHVAIQDGTGRTYAISVSAGGGIRSSHFDGSQWK